MLKKKQFLKCSININHLDHLLKISGRNIYFSECPTYLTVVLNHDISTYTQNEVMYDNIKAEIGVDTSNCVTIFCYCFGLKNS